MRWLLVVGVILIASGWVFADAPGAGTQNGKVVLYPNDVTNAHTYYTFDGKHYGLGFFGNGYLPLIDSLEAAHSLDSELKGEIAGYKRKVSVGERIFWVGAALAVSGATYMYYAAFTGGSGLQVYSGVGVGAIGIFTGLVGNFWAGEPTAIVDTYNRTYARSP